MKPRIAAFLRGSAAAALALLVLGPTAARAARDRPDIVIILSDDMGYSDLGCYGGEIETPNLDRLAAGGLRFTQFYNTARCCPTRASLLTGLYPHQAGVGHMMDDKGLDGYRGDLDSSCVTIAEALRPAGYGTCMAGKWHVTRHTSPDGPKHNWPLARGFDRFYGTITGAGSFFDPSTLTRDDTMISPFADPEYAPPRYYYTDAITDHAVRFVADHAKAAPEKPLFLYVAYTTAHWPMHALPEDIAKYRGRYDGGYAPIRRARLERMRRMGLVEPGWDLTPQAERWEEVEHEEWESRCMEVYAAMVDRMDQGIGRIVRELERTGRLEDTLILFLQDNGGCAEGVGRQPAGEFAARPDSAPFAPIPKEELQRATIPERTRDGFPVVRGPGVLPGPPDTYIAYGRGWANVSNTPFREYKHWVHEGGIATPLIAHWPARIRRKGDIERRPGHLVDLMATCIDAARADYPRRLGDREIQPMEGRSLLAAFEGRPIDRGAIYWEHEGNRAVRLGRWKLVAKGPAGPWELYDMEADRTEMHDLAPKHPERVRELAERWEAYARRARVLPWIWSPAYGEDPDDVGSPETTLRLEPGADLPRARSPRIRGRAFSIVVPIRKAAPDGVLVAQGGSSLGYALYVRDGKLAFAARHGGKLTVVAAKGALPEAPLEVAVRLGKDGRVVLEANGREVAAGTVPGPLPRMPLDGLQVGRDLGGAVGDYPPPFEFTGELGEATLRIE